MKNVFDYVKYYGNLTFFEVDFNDLDALVCAWLSYVKWDTIVSSSKTGSITIQDACEKFFQKYSKNDFKEEDWLFPNSYHLLELLKEARRYQKARLSYYVHEESEQTQFGALSIRLPNDITYLSFEGTTSAVIGWKEDLELIYQFPVKCQVKALEYFNHAVSLFDRTIYVGGHSKGGNLAMYAYLYGKDSIKKRVKQVYNFDGPGFLNQVLSSPNYEEMTKKLTMIVPEESVVGLSLEHGDYKVVKSSYKGILQHDCMSWECFGGFFVEGVLSRKSVKLEKNIKEYLSGMSEVDRKNFVNSFFAVFENLQITNVMQLTNLSLTNLLRILKEAKNVPSETKQNLVAILRLLITNVGS